MYCKLNLQKYVKNNNRGEKEIAGETPNLDFGKSKLEPLKGKVDSLEVPEGTFTLVEVGGEHEDGLSMMWEWINKHGISKFISALRYHTAIGHTGALFSKTKSRDIRWNINIIDAKGNSKTLPSGKLGSLLVHFIKEPKDHTFIKHNSDATSTSAHLLTYESKGTKSKDKNNKNHLVMNLKMIC